MSPPANVDLLRAVFDPKTVALIGASGTMGRLTARPQTFLSANGFGGRIYPINPKRSEVLGVKAYPDIAAVPEPIEHAYVLLDTEPAIAAFAACAEAGVKVVSMLADGFAEAGAAGRRRQDDLVRMADEAGVLLIGPNSTGVVDTRNGFVCTTNAAFAAETMPSGRFAVLSQSGSMIGTIFSRSAARGLGFSTYVSIGNEAQADVSTIGRLLLSDPETDGFVLFLETLRNPDGFAAFARDAHAQGKPVLAYVTGRSDEGQALSVSHTGALTGRMAALDSFLAAHGVQRVDVFEALLEAPHALAAMGPASTERPRTVTVVSTTGGGGAMVVDQLSLRGVPIAECPPTARAALERQAVPLGHGKLIDVTLAGTRYDVMKAVISALIEDPESGLILVAIGSSAQFEPELAVRPIVDAHKEAKPDAAPLLAIPLPEAGDSIRLLNEGGVPAFRTVESCADTVAILLQRNSPEPAWDGEQPTAAINLLASRAPGTLNEVDAGRVFQDLGIAAPAQIFVPKDDAVPSELPFDFPVVAKLVSSDLPHKTEAGAIVVGIADPTDLKARAADIAAAVADRLPDARIEGLLVQRQRSGLCEAIIGMTRDPLVGPIITVGMGGILAEVYRDTAVRPAPVSPAGARQMLEEVRGFAVLRGFRNAPRGDLTALADAVSAVSTLAEFDRIEEAEINPLLVGGEGEGVVMLDALIRLG